MSSRSDSGTPTQEYSSIPLFHNLVAWKKDLEKIREGLKGWQPANVNRLAFLEGLRGTVQASILILAELLEED